MKPLNNAERKAKRLKFIGLYSASIVLIIIALSSFLQPAPAIKTVVVENGKPAKVITKTVYVPEKNAAGNNFNEHDSLTAVIDFKQRKMDSLNAFIQAQNDTITKLQNLPVTAGKPVANAVPDKNEVAKFKKQIQFYDWALRSQIAVTNTLTKENKSLKEKIDQLNKSK